MFNLDGTASNSLTFHVAVVGQAPCSVGRVVKRVHRVVFGREGSYIESIGGGSVLPLREHVGVYVSDARVAPKNGSGQTQDFAWQGAVP